jgi:hypothetical protein
MRYGILIILAFFFIPCVSAYDNASMTDEYSQLVHDEQILAIDTAWTDAWGSWFYLLLVAGPYLGMVLYQRSQHMATIWLTAMLATYGYLLGDVIPNHIFYILVALWVAHILLKLLSPVYTN